MGLFDKYTDAIAAFLERKKKEGKIHESFHPGGLSWPVSKNSNLVLGQDTEVELGNPKDAATSFLLWCNEPDKVKNGRISVIGPDFPNMKSKQVPFGKIVIIGGSDFTEDNSYQRYRTLEQVRFDIHLKGYMMRGTSQYQREWSRVSKEAIDNGFSFNILGGALVEKFQELDFVRSVEVIFITSGREDVLEMKPIADQVSRMIGAMNKMAEEMSFDCDTCEYIDVCSEVAELRSIHWSHGARRSTHA